MSGIDELRRARHRTAKNSATGFRNPKQRFVALRSKFKSPDLPQWKRELASQRLKKKITLPDLRK